MATTSTTATTSPGGAAPAPIAGIAGLIGRTPPAAWVAAFVLLIMPLVANNFVLFQIFGWTFILGIIALSLMFLGGLGGMVSLGMAWWIAVPAAIVIATVFGTMVGALAVRTEGIYTIMITLAVAAAFFYFTRQNYTIFNGYSGLSLIVPPKLFGIDWRQPVAFYYLALGAATLCYGAVIYVTRSPFGIALQGVRDNPRRMAALGFNVVWHRILAYSFASVLASIGGILLVWQNAQIAPGTVGIAAVIDILVIAVIGGLRRPMGAFIGAFIYVLLSSFAPDVLQAFGLSSERFKLLIGLGFLAVVAFSPDGVLGLWDRFRERRRNALDPLTRAPR